MKFLIQMTVFFGVIYLGLFVHAISYDRKKKTEDIVDFSSHVKNIQLSLSFKSPEYKRFVYDK